MEALKKRVRGIGGIFFKSQDPEAAKQWYSQHLGIPADAYGAVFEWRHADNTEKTGMTTWSPFKMDTKYFEPSQQSFMINYIVDDLDGLLVDLRAAGVTIVDEIASYSYGKFLHILDGEGMKIELWEPSEQGFE